ncbi:MAG: glycosyltransferase [Proteobacteria bacterium]|nr:glycosyltransferase [Pseudomonadota bacterium]
MKRAADQDAHGRRKIRAVQRSSRSAIIEQLVESPDGISITRVGHVSDVVGALYALASLGHEIHAFRWHTYFDAEEASTIGRMARRLQQRLRDGPLVRRMNADLVEQAVEWGAEAVFVFRGDMVRPQTYGLLKRHLPATVWAGYNNDNPFSSMHPRHRFRHFVASLKELDLAFAYRPKNVVDFEQAGAPRAVLLPPWYIPEMDRPFDLSDDDRIRFGCDLAFIGHYEADGRLQKLEALAEAGHDVRLFGTGWDRVSLSSRLSRNGPVRPVRGPDYRKALCAAKIALVFLSKVNDDCYTRRNFEIPATGTFMLSEFSDELAALFEPGVHADYFSDQAELLAKAELYLRDEERRKTIARDGHAKVQNSGYDVVSRARIVADHLAAIRERLTA